MTIELTPDVESPLTSPVESAVENGPLTATRAESLRGLAGGAVHLPGDPGYDTARMPWSAAVDQRPAAVAHPRTVTEVAAVVRAAHDAGLRVAPQSTGHNAAPLAARGLDDVVLLRTSAMDAVRVDPNRRVARVEGGALWLPAVEAAGAHGLAALHGSSPDVGIAGYSLGGGMGWLARKHGLQTNSVTAFELVTADGHLVRADATHEPELFWALRGGGGNFGVVTAIEFAVYPYAELYAGASFFPFTRTREILQAWRELLPTLPDELMTWAAILHFPPDPALPETLRGGSFVVVWGVFTGAEAEGRRLLAPIRDLGPLLDTFALVPPAALGDLAMDPRDPLPFLSGHQLLGDVPAEAVDALVDATGPGSDATISMVQLRHLGGALARADAAAGARATLPGSICVFSLGVAPDADSARATQATLARIDAALDRYRVGDYPNFVEEPSDVRRFFDAKIWGRLREVKALYDPDELFQANHPIPPARRRL
jgi:FAD/FMN-containing dehydrogenase